MVTALDGLFGPLAKQLISQLGGLPGTLKGRSAGSFDTATGKRSETWTTYSVTLTPPSPYRVEPKSTAFVETPGAIQSFLRTLVAQQDTGLAGYVPKVGDTLTIQGRTHRIAIVEPISSGEQIAAYQLILEGSGSVP